MRSAGLLRRLWFNLRLPTAFDPEAVDVVVSVDFDGCFVPSSPTPRLACLKGVAADELRYEEGIPRMRLAAQARLERRALHLADRVVVPSRYSMAVASEAYDLPADRFAVVPEGIDLDAWTRPERPPSDDGRPPVILSVARQYPRKNTGALLRALPAVRSRLPGARLRVVGGGPRLPALRSLAAELELGDAVAFRGELEDLQALRREYARADVFCLPTRQEGFGIVFLEAMASGLPVVAGDAAAVPEVVPDGEAGLLVPPTDAEALAGAIVRLLEDPELRDRMGRRGRERVRAFAWERVAERFESVVAGVRADGVEGVDRG